MKKVVETIERVGKKVNHLGKEVKHLGTKVVVLEIKVDQIGTKLDILETRFDTLGTKVDKLETRFGNLEIKVDKIDSNLNDFKTYFEDKFSELVTFLTENIMLRDETEQRTNDRIDTKFTKYTSDQFEFQDKVGKQCETNTNENLAMNQRVTLIEKHIGI